MPKKRNSSSSSAPQGLARLYSPETGWQHSSGYADYMESRNVRIIELGTERPINAIDTPAASEPAAYEVRWRKIDEMVQFALRAINDTHDATCAEVDEMLAEYEQDAIRERYVEQSTLDISVTEFMERANEKGIDSSAALGELIMRNLNKDTSDERPRFDPKPLD